MSQSAIPMRGTSHVHLGWLGLGALLVAVALLAGFAGYYINENQAAPANPDQALADNLAAAWSAPYDAAKIAALYAPDATVYEKTDANETSAGLPAIQARASNLGSSGFKVMSTSTPIRQGDFVAVFQKFGTDGEATDGALLVVQLKDGKVLNQWVYPAP